MSEHIQQPEEDIRIRDYSIGTDFLEVAELLHKAGMFNPERDRKEQLERIFGKVRMKVAVAMGERIVGSVYINGGIGLIEGVVVHPEFRRMGVGSRLVREAMRQLREDGHRYAELQIDFDENDEEEGAGLRKWYESLGFTVAYSVRGMMQAIEVDPLFEAPKLSTDVLERRTVNQAFMDLYMKHRDRMEYYAPLDPDYISPTTREEFEEIKRCNPTRSVWELDDAYQRGWFSHPPLRGQSIQLKGTLKETYDNEDMSKHFSIPMLRGSYFFDMSWGHGETTPWIAFSSGGEGTEIEHVQCWFGRRTELAHPLKPKPDVTEIACFEDHFYKIPNDNLLFLRQIKGIQRFGEPPSLANITLNGNYLCYDRANENIFAFSINDKITELLGAEETAIIQEEMVRYVRAYELLAERPKRRAYYPEI